MISSDIWHKYQSPGDEVDTTSDISKLLDVISRAVRRVKFETILKYHEWYLCQISRTNHAIICLYYYPQKVVIFTCRYFKLSWNITALSQSNCRNVSCSIINSYIELLCNVWRTNCSFFPLTQCISFCAKMALSFHRRPKRNFKILYTFISIVNNFKEDFFRCRSAPYPVSHFLLVLKKCLLVNLILLFVRPD